MLTKFTTWHSSHTDLSRLFVDRLRQLVCPVEPLTFRAPTANGLIMLREIAWVSDSLRTRPKAAARLQRLVEEASGNESICSIRSDFILTEFFPRAHAEALSWAKLEQDRLVIIGIAAKQILREVEDSYLRGLTTFLQNVDWSATNFDREAQNLNLVAQSLATQLIYDGYSVTYIHKLASTLAESEVASLHSLLATAIHTERDSFPTFLADVSTPLKQFLVNPQETSVMINDAEVVGLRFFARGREPLAAAAMAITEASRQVELRQLDPESTTGSILDQAYYSIDLQETVYLPATEVLHSDPLFGRETSNTLKSVLSSYNLDLKDLPNDVLDVVEEPLYYYNQARKAPSPENKFVQLWTALEAMQGLRSNDSDIAAIKRNVGNALSHGAYLRRLRSLAHLLVDRADQYEWNGFLPQERLDTEEELCVWAEWCSRQYEQADPAYPYHYLKRDPLSCLQYRTMKNELGTLGNIEKLLQRSLNNVEFQLERLYMTRNSIVHQGRSVGAALLYQVVHLENYVGVVLGESIRFASGERPEEVAFWDWYNYHIGRERQLTNSYLAERKADRMSAVHAKESGLLKFRGMSV